MSTTPTTMPQKRTALAAAVRSVLQAHDAGFTVDERIREATLDGRDRADRISVMGDPVRYADVTYAGERTYGPTLNIYARPLTVAHLFRVSVWVGYVDHDTYALSSQALWDQVMEGAEAAGDDADGLLTHFRTLATVTTSGGAVCEVSAPEAVDVPAIAALAYSGQRTEYAHQAQFTLTIR